MSEPVSMLAAMAWYGLLGVLLVLATQGKRAGFTGFLVVGIFLVLAEILYHGPEILFEDPYRAGWLSKGLEIVVMALGAALAVFSGLALRKQKGVV